MTAAGSPSEAARATRWCWNRPTASMACNRPGPLRSGEPGQHRRCHGADGPGRLDQRVRLRSPPMARRARRKLDEGEPAEGDAIEPHGGAVGRGSVRGDWMPRLRPVCSDRHAVGHHGVLAGGPDRESPYPRIQCAVASADGSKVVAVGGMDSGDWRFRQFVSLGRCWRSGADLGMGRRLGEVPRLVQMGRHHFRQGPDLATLTRASR